MRLLLSPGGRLALAAALGCLSAWLARVLDRPGYVPLAMGLGVALGLTLLSLAAGGRRDRPLRRLLAATLAAVLAQLFHRSALGFALGLGAGIATSSRLGSAFGLLGGGIGGLLAHFTLPLLAGLLHGLWTPYLGDLLRVAGAMAGVWLVERQRRDAWLEVKSGPLAGTARSLFQEGARVGGDARCDLVVGEPERSALVVWTGEHFAVQAESGPLHVNGRRLERAGLANGDEIRLGDSLVVFRERVQRQKEYEMETASTR